MDIKCKSCGKSNPSTAKTCAKCYAALKKVSEPKPTEDNSAKSEDDEKDNRTSLFSRKE